MRYYELTEARPKNFRQRKPMTQSQIDTIISNNGGNMEEWYDEVNGFANDLQYLNYGPNSLSPFEDAISYFNRYLGQFDIHRLYQCRAVVAC